jgi:hypothetical protein
MRGSGAEDGSGSSLEKRTHQSKAKAKVNKMT